MNEGKLPLVKFCAAKADATSLFQIVLQCRNIGKVIE